MTQEINFEQKAGYRTRWAGMIFIGISLLVISIDNTILNVALPSISRSLGASAAELQWIIAAYVLMFAALLLTMGSLGDRFGRKRALQVGLIMFAIGSASAGFSKTTLMLIGSRAFLGIGGSLIMPSTLSIISATFPTHERAKAIAIWAAVFGLGIGIGPVVGGWLIEQFSWNAVFFVNLPVAAVALTGGAFLLAESRDETARRLDLPGILLSIPGLFALIYGIIQAGQSSWTAPQVLIAFGAAIVLLVSFALWENRSPQPMLPLYFFRNMSFTGANIAMVLVMFSMFGSVFFMSQYLQSVLGFTALESGIRMLPLGLTMMVFSVMSARLAERVGTKYMVALGIAIAGTALLFMSQFFEVGTSYGTVVIGLILLPAGLGLTMSPATNSIMQSVPVNKAGIGSAMNDTTRQLGGALGVAILGTVMNNIYIKDIQAVKEAIPQLPDQAFEVIASSVQGAHIIVNNAPLPEAAKLVILDIANAAFVSGMSAAMFVGAFLMFSASLLALAIFPNRVQRPDSELSGEPQLTPAPSAGD